MRARELYGSEVVSQFAYQRACATQKTLKGRRGCRSGSEVRVLFLGLLLCLVPAAFAQQDAPVRPTIRVAATATIAAKPDRAQIDIGVVTQAQQADQAATDNAKQVGAVLAALRHAAGEGADIQTLGYTLTPDFRYAAGSEPVLVGYTASNVVRVTLDDLKRVGSVADAATHSGADRVQDMRFTLREPESVRLQALRQAALQANSEADALASALGVRVLRVLSVEENGSMSVPMRHMLHAAARARTDEESTPIETGTLNVSADIALTVEVGERHGAP